jgi:hypothetical protein
VVQATTADVDSCDIIDTIVPRNKFCLNLPLDASMIMQIRRGIMLRLQQGLGRFYGTDSSI